MRNLFRTSLVVMAFMSLPFFLLFHKPFSSEITSAESAYPPPDSSVLEPTPQVDTRLSAYPPPSPTQETTFQQDSTTLILDAKEYASVMGVDIKEAVHRLQLQDDIDELNGRLTTGEPDTFGGL